MLVSNNNIEKTELSKSRKAVITDITCIVILWILCALIVNPIGNFPLNDDWSYGLTVKNLLEKMEFNPTNWASMTLITNVIWGSVFCIPSGFSFTALRISTLTISLLGIIGIYIVVRELSKSRWLAIFISLMLGFNPIYYSLSNTFMTDIPCTALMILSSLFFVKYMEKKSGSNLLFGLLLSFAAILSRQIALVVPIAFTLVIFLTQPKVRRNILHAIIPIGISLIILLGIQFWLKISGKLPKVYYLQWEILLKTLKHPKVLINNLNNNIYVALSYIGLFLFPLLIVIIPAIIQLHKRKIIIILSAASGIMVLFYKLFTIKNDSIVMPLSENILLKSGIGPLTLRDTQILGLNHVQELPANFWLVITIISFIGGVLFISVIGSCLIDTIRNFRAGKNININEAIGIFFLLTSILYSFPILVNGFYDRYLIPPAAFLAISITAFYGNIPGKKLLKITKLRFAAVVLVTVMFLFSIGTTRDYLEWNRVRWIALNNLVEDNHIIKSNIDGGFEFNGYYFFDYNYERTSEKSWWWVQGDEYQVGFGEVPGYKIIKKYIYNNWIPSYTGKIVVLQKKLITEK